MLVHFLKFSIRNLSKRKGYSTLNIFGLLVGAVCAVIILQYVSFERSFDRFHADAERIYRLQLDFISADRTRSYATSYAPLAELMTEDYAEIEGSGRLIPAYGGNLIRVESKSGGIQKHKMEHVYRANQGFWDLFSFNLISGDERQLLTRPNTAIISHKSALLLFGTTQVVGQTFIRNNADSYEVTGVFEDLPANAHMQFEMLLSRPELVLNEFVWRSYNTYNYIKVSSNADAASLEASIANYIDQYRTSPNYEMRLKLQPLLSLHFNDTTLQDRAVRGDKEAINALYVMSIVIVLIACINFVNLSSARALNRGKETVMRKVFGSSKAQLFLETITESVIVYSITWGLAVSIVYSLGPLLLSKFGIDIGSLGFNEFLVGHVVIFFAFGATISGVYPAIVLQSFRVNDVIRGRNAISTKGGMLRKALVTLQYTASLTLTILTVVVFKQVEFMRKADLGINIDQTVVVHSPSTRDSTIFQKLASLKDQWMQISGVSAIAYSQEVPGATLKYSFGGVRKMTETEGHQFQVTNVRPKFAEFYGLEFIAGRNMSENITSDVGKVYVNESAMRLLGFDSPEETVNQELAFPRENVRIIGVIKDFHIASVKQQITPSIFHYRPEYWPFGLDLASIRIESSDQMATLGKIKEVFLANFPNDVFDAYFLGERFASQYESDIIFGKLFSLFSVLSLIISSMGLLGLISFSIIKQLKQMSIRKVLGANTGNILLLFSWNFLGLLGVAILVALPFSYFLAIDWLESFAQRLPLNAGLFILPILSVLAITMLLIIYRTYLAARRNPVDYLRQE